MLNWYTLPYASITFLCRQALNKLHPGTPLRGELAYVMSAWALLKGSPNHYNLSSVSRLLLSAPLSHENLQGRNSPRHCTRLKLQMALQPSNPTSKQGSSRTPRDSLWCEPVSPSSSHQGTIIKVSPHKGLEKGCSKHSHQGFVHWGLARLQPSVQLHLQRPSKATFCTGAAHPGFTHRYAPQ